MPKKYKNPTPAPDSPDGTPGGVLLPVRTALIFLLAIMVGTSAGVLTFFAGQPVAAAVLAGIASGGVSLRYFHDLIA